MLLLVVLLFIIITNARNTDATIVNRMDTATIVLGTGQGIVMVTGMDTVMASVTVTDMVMAIVGTVIAADGVSKML